MPRAGWLWGAALIVTVLLGAGTWVWAAGAHAPRGASAVDTNPAARAAVEVIRIESVAPFSPVQVQHLVPVLQALAEQPSQSRLALARRAGAMESVLTKGQRNALANGIPPLTPKLWSDADDSARADPMTLYQRAIHVLESEADGGRRVALPLQRDNVS